MSGHVDPQNHGTLPSLKNIQPPQHSPGDFPSGQTRAEQAAPLSLQRKPNDVESDPPEVPVPGLEGVLVLRVMPDDNSCMFRALGSAVLGDALDAMNELRSMVAQTIQSNPDLYTAGMLEKAPDDYCRWIQREDSWGGGIELAILSQQFDIEICSINVQDLRIDRFNEGKPRRCILIYSGIHYDVVAVSPGPGTSPEFDRKIFEVAQIEGMEGEDGGALQAARELCQILQQRHYYTDTHGFTIKCNVCGWTGKGEKGATEHAKQTGHMNFGEA
ncbi:OTU-domain-containing protein, partial [Aureobasidium melanogenum]